MLNHCYVHIFDAHLLHVSVLVHHHHKEKLRHFLEKTTSIVILLSVGSVLYLIRHEHKYIIKCTTAYILKAHNGTISRFLKLYG
jgi:hypothetical protein